MSRLTQFLDWLDEAAGGLIRVAYLAAGVTAVAVYFGAGQLPANVDHWFNVALPWALAFALETHTYLTARRVRAAWQDHEKHAMKVNIGILAVLLAFSAWNQLGYLNGVWSPPHTGALALPLWLAYAVRALIVPVAFMAAAFLAPLAPPITMQIEGEARATLADVFKIARKQRKHLLQDAERSGRDLTGALVELVTDPETRRIISHAYAAIGAPITRALPVTPAPLAPPSTRAIHHPGDDAEMADEDENDQRATQPQMRAVIGGQSFDLDWGDEYDPDNPDDDDDPDDSRSHGTKTRQNGHKPRDYQAPRNGTTGARNAAQAITGDRDPEVARRKRVAKANASKRKAALEDLRQEQIHQVLSEMLDENPGLTPNAFRRRVDEMHLGNMRNSTANHMINSALARRGLTRYPSTATAEYDGDEGDDREAFDLDDLAETREMRAIQA